VRILIAEHPPNCDPAWKPIEKMEKLDYYYLYHGTMAIYRMGGKDWESWNKALVRTLLATQDPSGCWPIDRWTKDGGRVYSTAMAALCLEVYYRYQ
jgi:hypothetical protein